MLLSAVLLTASGTTKVSDCMHYIINVYLYVHTFLQTILDM